MMYDPLTVFYLLDPAACQVRSYNVRVETKGELTRGMTVADRRPVGDGTPANVTVVMDINSQAFTEKFLATIG
jgi:inosine-uridine nucleoside N-ribohydrolase